jgi:hypothetical protein
MGWRALPPVDWWIVTGGVVWSIFWMTAACLLTWAVASLRDRLGQPALNPL